MNLESRAFDVGSVENNSGNFSGIKYNADESNSSFVNIFKRRFKRRVEEIYIEKTNSIVLYVYSILNALFWN